MSAKTKPKKKTRAPDIVFSVRKFRFLFFRGNKMSYSTARRLLDDSPVEFRDRLKDYGSYPAGIMGGPINPVDKEKVIDAAYAFFKGVKGIKRDDFTTELRFKVMRDDNIANDLGFDYKNGTYRPSDENGFPNRKFAFAAAEQHYNEAVAFTYNGHGSPSSNKVILILHDSEGKVVRALSNAGKKLRSDS